MEQKNCTTCEYFGKDYKCKNKTSYYNGDYVNEYMICVKWKDKNAKNKDSQRKRR